MNIEYTRTKSNEKIINRIY